MEFRLLGPVEVLDGDRTIALAGTKQTALLARLVLDANRVVSVERLLEDLWDGAPPSSAVATLQGYITVLRRALQPGISLSDHVLQTRRPGYVLEARDAAVDVLRFEALVGAGRRAAGEQAWEEAAGLLTEALGLWRGPALSDVAGHRFADAEIRRLEEARLDALEERITADLNLGQHARLVGELEALLDSAPLREPLSASLILALYRCGRQAEALDRYRALQCTLADELGIDPSPELQRLREAVLLQKPELDWVPPHGRHVLDPAPDDEPVPVFPHNLPVELTGLVGRAEAAASVSADLAAARLVTLVGVGGIGKTRLALRVGREVLERFPDGVWQVELAPLQDPTLLAERILAVLDRGREPGGDATVALIDRLDGSQSLLLLDNCEHVLAGCRPLVEALLRASPGVRVLATSREPLRVPGERLRRVTALSVPEAGWAGDPAELRRYTAASLFIDRAAATDPDFTLDSSGAEAVAKICRRLDGIPLALELAAARVRILSPRDLAARLDDRFGVLGLRNPAAAPRHRTLLAVLDWSHQLLTESERALLAQLSVFPRTFDLDAVEAVGETAPHDGGVLEVFAGLVDKSLVVSEEQVGGRRYRLLETVRQYARDTDGDAAAIQAARDRHAVHYLAVAERSEPRLYGPELTAVLATLAEDHESFRVALDRLAQAHDPGQVRLAAALWRYCYLRGHYRDGRGWLGRALASAASAATADAVARATQGAATLAFLQCDYDQAQRLSEEALIRFRFLGDRGGEGAILTLLGSIERERGNHAHAIELHAESLAICEEADDLWGIAHRMQCCCLAAWLSGDHAGAAVWAGRSTDRCRELRDDERDAWGLIDLGAIAHYAGDAEAARAPLEESLTLCRRLAFQEGIAWVQNLLGLVAHGEGDDVAALEHLTESLRVHTSVGDRWRSASVLEALAAALTATDPGVAVQLGGAARRIRATIGTPVPPCEQPLVERTEATLLDELGRARYEALRRDGSRLSVQAAARLVEQRPG